MTLTAHDGVLWSEAPAATNAPPPPAAPGSDSMRPLVVRWKVALLAGVLGALTTAAATGIPTELIPTPWFTRMTPVQSYAYPVWAITAALTGVLLALHLGVSRGGCRVARAERPAGVLGILGSFLAVGCPVCNKLVIALIGVSGATNYFAASQPVLAAASLAVLTAVLAVRIRVLTRS